MMPEFHNGQAVTYIGKPDHNAVVIDDKEMYVGWVAIEFDGIDHAFHVPTAYLRPAPAWDPKGYDHDQD